MTLKRPALIIKRSFGNFLGSLVWSIAIPTRPDNYEQRIVEIHSNLVAIIASYHTRAIRKVFKERFSYLMGINTPRTSLSEVMYSLATGDSSAVYSKAVQKRGGSHLEAGTGYGRPRCRWRPMMHFNFSGSICRVFCIISKLHKSAGMAKWDIFQRPCLLLI